MERQTELRLIKEAIKLNEQGETQYQEAPTTQGIQRYVSKAWFDREVEHLFSGNALAIGVEAEVPNIGDYHATEWVNGLSLLMVRDQNNQVRVFANACRHRNARLIDNGESGCKKKFRCPYHAWTYGTDGSLLAAPDFERGFTGFDKKDLGLIEFDSKVVEGVVYIHPDVQQKVPDDIASDELASGFRYLDIANQRVYKRRTYNIKANWKILTEGGIEAYHFNVAHRDTLAPFFLGNLSTWESMGGMNLRMVLPKKPLLQARELPEEKWNLRQMANLMYVMSPGMLFLAQPDNVSLIKMVPLGPNETRIEEVLLVDQPSNGEDWNADELAMHETNYQLVYKILSEDWELGETIQANMDSGAVNTVHFGRFESALTWFHEEYEKLMEIESWNPDLIVKSHC